MARKPNPKTHLRTVPISQRVAKQTRKRRSDTELRAVLAEKLHAVEERQQRRLMREYKNRNGTDTTILELITHYQALKTAVKHMRSANLDTDQVCKHLSEVSTLVALAIAKSGVVPPLEELDDAAANGD